MSEIILILSIFLIHVFVVGFLIFQFKMVINKRKEFKKMVDRISKL